MVTRSEHITARQGDVLAAVRALWSELGHSPSHAELVNRTGLSRTTVRDDLKSLAAAGHIRLTPGQFRSIVPLEEAS